MSWLLKRVEAAEVLADRGAEVAVGLAAAVGAQVLPEQRVQDVAREVEGEVLLELVDGAEVVAVAGLGELLERGVRAGDVGGVVLVVVQLEDLGRVVRLERARSRRAGRAACTRSSDGPFVDFGVPGPHVAHSLRTGVKE